MSAETALDSTAPATKLPVAATAVHAFRDVLGRPRAFIRLAALPALLTLGVIYGFPFVAGTTNPTTSILLLAAVALPLGWLGLAWLRFSFLGGRPQLLPSAPWHRDGMQVVGYCLPCFLWFLCTPLVFEFFYERYATGRTGQEFEIAAGGGLAFMLLGCYFAGRLLLAAPAIAVSMERSPQTAWRLSRGHGLRLFGAVVLVMVAMLIASILCSIVYQLLKGLALSLLDLPYDPLWAYPMLPDAFQVIAALGLTIGTCVLAQMLAIAYRHLSGWSGPREDLLERFE